MWVFAMQHGMLWVGNPILPEQHGGVPYNEEAANRLGSWSGPDGAGGARSAPADAFCTRRHQDRTPVRQVTSPRRCCALLAQTKLRKRSKGGRMIPRRFAPLLFAFLLSGTMSLLVSGITTYRTAGMVDHFVGLWLSAWIPSWLVAFPTVMLAAPLARKAVQRLVAAE
jgi:hypothetical protein